MVAIQEKYLKEFAANSEHTIDDLLETAENLHTAVQSQLNDHFENCHLHRGKNYWLFEEDNGVWLAFNKFELGEQMRNAGIEYDTDKLINVGYAYLDQFQERGLTIEVPGSVARRLEDPFFFPIFVPFPENWDSSKYHTFQQFQELVWRYNMTPAEALDYWVTEYLNRSSNKWAGKRDVQTEAVRKNVRQAKEKLNHDELGASHENSIIRPVSLDDVPDGDPHDAKEDVFYVPTEESLDEYE